MAKQKAFTVPATFAAASTLVDGGISVRFKTQELPKEEKERLFDYVNAFGWLLFSTEALGLTDIPKDTPEKNSKTPSQRLRASIYVLWEMLGSEGDFEVFYRQQMEKVISFVKNKISEVETKHD